MNQICVSSLQFMNHSQRQPRFGMNKVIGNQLSWDRMGINSRNSTLNTFVGTKSFMSKEELAVRPMKYSQLVGGFVGSKSQLGTSNRISCQIWDIVFCKLMSFMNSSNIKSASSLGSSEYSYAFFQELATDMFDSMYRDISEHSTPPADISFVRANAQVCNNLMAMNSEKHNFKNVSAVLNNQIAVPQQDLHSDAVKDNCKQSYAEVTKTAKHTTVMTGNVKHTNTICPKSNVKTKNVQMVSVSELNNPFQRKKQKCRRRKANISNYEVKLQNSCIKGGSKYKNDHRKMTNLKAQNAIKRQTNTSATDVTKDAPENIECDANDMLLIFTNKPVNESTSLDLKEEHNSCRSSLPNSNKSKFEFMATFEKKCASPHRISNDTSWNCSQTDTEVQNHSIKEEDVFLPKKPSFSHVNDICTPKRNRFHSDSSDSDDFVIFAITETEIKVESSSEEDIGDCFSDCDIEETWDTQEDTDDIDNQVAENLRTINEKWEKMYSCFPGKPKEPKKVQFASNEKLRTVHSIIAWDFAYRAARIGCWQQIALDQERFMRRILQLEQIISPVLTREHRLCARQRIMKYLNDHSES